MTSHPYRLSGSVLVAVLAVLLAGCASGDDASVDDTDDTDTTATVPDGDASVTDDVTQGPSGEDPNEQVEEGVYRGEGVVLPVPDGFALDQAAFAQGVVVAVNDETTQQLTARAVDAESLQAQGQPPEFDALLDNIRQEIGQEPEVDEAVELSGAERAHRFTFLALPPQQQGGSESSVTIVLAEDGEGLFGEFVFAAIGDTYDEDVADLLLAEAGFDPDSEPSAPPAPARPGNG